MPCDSSGLYDNWQAETAYSEAKMLRKELDLVTRLLCTLTKSLDVNTLDPELRQWVEQHRELDAKRSASGRGE